MTGKKKKVSRKSTPTNKKLSGKSQITKEKKAASAGQKGKKVVKKSAKNGAKKITKTKENSRTKVYVEVPKVLPEINFRQATNEKDFKSIHDYTIEAFSDSPDFRWDLDQIKREVKSGWELYAAFVGKEVIAAVFLKPDGGRLLSKNTSVKMNYQGSGYSHKIKDFVEKIARDKKIGKIINYCGIDNFRMYSLNESHGYRKTGARLGDRGQVVEWIKELK
jgi:hypothetical protein